MIQQTIFKHLMVEKYDSVGKITWNPKKGRKENNLDNVFIEQFPFSYRVSIVLIAQNSMCRKNKERNWRNNSL